MNGVSFRVTAATAVLLLFSSGAGALSFDERWQSMYLGSEVSGDTISAKAEMRPRAERIARAERARVKRPQANRSRVSSRRGERVREWHKGGKKWHGVNSRRRRG